MVYKETCTSCGVGLIDEGYSVFLCPNCGNEVIGRCKTCREHSTPYVCDNCGFEGP
ncbi:MULTISPECIES: zinc finger domain-containing protein [unclassified Thermoplasma]|uniref:zinc finger domain-containing protein n=1 Tax=unclassified Thermoplasma TaxID=2684908 RepID=UPI000D99F864|nr:MULTISPECIES: zinc finger domain-containing protein [unclassified Thermoplasma]PYB68822.1 RNA-binding protein [Thermoplasma sp. Kam2015]